MKMLFLSILINNVVLLSFLGLENILDTTKKSMDALGIIVSTVIIMIISSITNYWIYQKLIIPFNLQMLMLVLFSVNIVLMSFVTKWVLEKFLNILYTDTKDYIPIAAVSSLIIGMALLNIDKGLDIYDYVYMNLFNALGFALIVILLTTIRDRISYANIPNSLKGAPIVLITLGLISMAFMGFLGVGHL